MAAQDNRQTARFQAGPEKMKPAYGSNSRHDRVDAASAGPRSSLPQLSIPSILGIWAAAALPMAGLGWLVSPWLAGSLDRAAGIPGTTRILAMTVGLVWQFVIVLVLVRREAGRLSWSSLRDRLWLQTPRQPRTGQPDRRMWLWLVPLVILYVFEAFAIGPALQTAWISTFPFLAEPPQFSFSQLIDVPENRALLEGAWWFYGLFLLLAIFNTVLGEELLFRGVLLPRMRGSFGNWDWLANGVLFGFYHLHQPWGILGGVVSGALLFALPARLFQSAWMSIVIHSGQSVFFAVILLPYFRGSG